MADRISDAAFERLSLSKQLEFAAAHLREADETGLQNLTNEDITTMLMHSLCMARNAHAMERELARHRDEAKLRTLRLEVAFAAAEEPGSNVAVWPIIPRHNCDCTDFPKGAA